MARSIVGLDLGHTGVRAVALSRRRSAVALTGLGTAALEPGAVMEGEVADVDAVAAAIRQACGRRSLGREAVLGVSGRHVVVRQVELPWLEPKAFRKALPYRVAAHLPVPVDDAVLDYVVVGPGAPEASGAPTVRVLLVAVTRESVTRAVLAVEKAGLRPVRVDLSGLALLRVGAGDPLPEGAAEARVDIGAEVTTLVIHIGGTPRFVRVLSGEGGLKGTRALAERMKLPADEAEELKRELGVTRPGVAVPEDPVQRSARAILDRVNDATLAAVRGSLDYFLSNVPDVEGLGRVVLSGGGAQLPGLRDRLADALGIPVVPVDTLAGLSVNRRAAGQAEELAPALATATGLSLAEVA